MKGLVAQKVIVEVKGGVGNQMFQYAAARSLSLDLNAELVIEKKLGFMLDRQYRSTFQLDHFSISYTTGTLYESLPFIADRIRSFFGRRVGHKEVKKTSRNYLFERNFHFVNLAAIDPHKRCYRLAGYYQDPRYFETHKDVLLRELTPPTPTDQRYIDLANLGREYNLIALGIRMYEESSFPAAHARDKMVKTSEEYRLALARLLERVPKPLVLVFTSREFDFLNSMNLPAGCIFVNPDRGYTDTIDTLWLMSKCQHHIFNNSTFYWWGAVLSGRNYNPSEQKIFCSDNFLNPAISYPNWDKF